MHVLVLSIKGSCWLCYRYRVFHHSQVKLFLHKAKIQNLYFHLNFLLSSVYGLSFFFSKCKLWTHRFLHFIFFMLGKCVLIRACYHRYASFHEGNFYNSLGHLIHQPHDLKLTVYWLLGQQVYQGFHYFLRPLLRKLLLFLSLFILQALGWPFF